MTPRRTGALKTVAHTTDDTARFAFDRNVVYTGEGVPVFTNSPLALPYALSTLDRNVYWEEGAALVLFPGQQPPHAHLFAPAFLWRHVCVCVCV